MKINLPHAGIAVSASCLVLLILGTSAHAYEFGVTLSRLHLDTSGGTGAMLEDEFSADNVDGSQILVDRNAFIPSLPPGSPAHYSFFSAMGNGGVWNTELLRPGLDYRLPDNTELHMILPGGRNPPDEMTDTGSLRFETYQTNLRDLATFGLDYRETETKMWVILDPYDVNELRYMAEYGYVGADSAALISLTCRTNNAETSYTEKWVLLQPADTLGLGLEISPGGETSAFYNLNGSAWSQLGAATVTWWPGHAGEIHYGFAVEHRVPEPGAMVFLVSGTVALVLRHRRNSHSL